MALPTASPSRTGAVPYMVATFDGELSMLTSRDQLEFGSEVVALLQRVSASLGFSVSSVSVDTVANIENNNNR